MTRNVLWSRASVCLSVCLSAAACSHYCTDPDVTWGVVGDAPLVVHCWADLQSVHGLRCCGNIMRTRNVSEYMLVLAVCLGKEVKAFPYSIPSVGPGADSGVQAVSPQVTISHPPGGRLPLLSTMSAVTSPAAEYHRPLAGTKLYCLVTEAHRCEQLAQGCYAALHGVGLNPRQ